LLGKPAPSFDLALYPRYLGSYGTHLSIPDPRGRPLVVNFWASWCAPCAEEAPLLQAAFERYRNRGVLFVGVQTQDRDHYGAGARFIDRFGWTFPVGMDNDSSVAVAYGLFGVPETYFIDRHGIIVYKRTGVLTDRTLAKGMAAILR